MSELDLDELTRWAKAAPDSGVLLHVSDALALIDRAREAQRLRNACIDMNHEVCQTLGKVLGFPWFKDDQANFFGATEEQGVCVGDHVAETMAEIAAERITKLEAENAALREALVEMGYAREWSGRREPWC